MDRQILSQEEINALLKDTESIFELTPLQKDALGEIGNITYGTAATALSELLRQQVNIDTPTLYVTTQQEIKEQHPTPYVLIQVKYKAGLAGSNILIMNVRDAAIIADLMMGGDGTNPKTEMGQMEMSAVSEAMNQMIGNSATSMSSLFGKRVEIVPPQVGLIDLAENDSLIIPDQALDDQLVVISFKLKIGDLSDSDVMLIIPYQFAVEMADGLTGTTEPELEPEPAPMVSIIEPPSMEPAYNPPPLAAAPPPPPSPQPQVLVQPAQFAPLGGTKSGKESGNIGLILDVPLQVTVELGSTKMKIKDILELGLGSVIELDKLAGDPVDIYVNGKLIAKGEVVVIDENFGIRICDIISPIERANTLQ